MMVTDEERREVARRLRGLEVCELDGEFIDCGEVEDVLGLVSDDGAWYEAECVMRLADIIDPLPQCPLYHSDRHYCSIYEDVDVIDRDMLLTLAEGLDNKADDIIRAAQHARFSKVGPTMDEAKHEACEWRGIAHRIREALGE